MKQGRKDYKNLERYVYKLVSLYRKTKSRLKIYTV